MVKKDIKKQDKTGDLVNNNFKWHRDITSMLDQIADKMGESKALVLRDLIRNKAAELHIKPKPRRKG